MDAVRDISCTVKAEILMPASLGRGDATTLVGRRKVRTEDSSWSIITGETGLAHSRTRREHQPCSYTVCPHPAHDREQEARMRSRGLLFVLEGWRPTDGV